jgi:hypothetical protein
MEATRHRVFCNSRSPIAQVFETNSLQINNIHLKIARLYLEILLKISLAPDRIEHLKQLPSRGRKQSTRKTGTAQEQREEAREQAFGHFAQILPSSSFFFFLGEFSH